MIPVQIRDLVENALYTYANAADRRDIGALGVLFTNCSLAFGDEIAEGRVPVERLYRQRLAAGPPTKHLISNILITPAVPGDSTWVDVSCSYVRMAYRPAPQILSCSYVRMAYRPAPQILSLGEYHATLVITDSKSIEFRKFQVKMQWPQTGSTPSREQYSGPNEGGLTNPS